MEEAKNCLLYADIAFSNKQYIEALAWYRKALEITPDNIYALSRAGALCVSMGRFEDALAFFGRAKTLDPDNGDNAFNYGNACFFNKDNVKAFEMYVEAEKVGCSDDVKPRLYYQMALLCSMRQDIKSALLYFRKCEESDKSGMISLNPDLISEKLKLYMVQEDFTNAEKCAAQLVAINPTDFKGYMVYFSILMAHKSYDAAEKLLADAEKYAELSEENSFALMMQVAALNVTKGDNENAIRVLEERKRKGDLADEQLSQLLLALAEAHSKNGSYDVAISLLQSMLTGHAYARPDSVECEQIEPVGELTPFELDDMIQHDVEEIQDGIASGRIDADLIAGNIDFYVTYDEEGDLVHYYDELALVLDENTSSENDDPVQAPVGRYELPKELREKVVFTLLSCHLAKDEFAAAQKLANVLKHSENKYYGYFGLYTSTMAERKLTGDSDVANRKYAEAIAFFRNRSFADATDTLACIFRARLYAEQGKYEKAAEIAQLLSDADKEAVMVYIESCKK